MAQCLKQNHSRENATTLLQDFRAMTQQQKTCPICLCPVVEEQIARIKTCQHLFCYDCIDKWAKTKLTCPLCYKEFEVIEFHFGLDGTIKEKKFEKPVKKPDDVEFDVSCLDFSYFLDEVNRLLQNGERLFKVTNALGRQTGKVYLHLAYDSSSSQTLHTVLLTLRNIKKDLLDEVRFDPLVLLQQLYALECTLKELWNGRTTTTTTSHSQNVENDRLNFEGKEEYQESEDDDFDDEEQNDDESDDELAFMYPSVTKTSKRSQTPSFRLSGESNKKSEHKRWK